jgi:hypothetical protein
MQERAAWFQTFMDNFTPALSLLLGFTAPERSALDDDNTDFQHIASTQAAVDNFVAAWRQYRISLCEDPVGTPTPVFPNENFSAVPVGVPAGIFQRLIEAVERIRAHPAYTDEIGANLGIKPATPVAESFVDQAPEFKVKATPGNIVVVEFVRRGSDGIVLERQVDAESDWTPAGTFLKSPGQVQIPANGGLPRAVRLRARFLVGNDPTGNYSNTVNVVTTP